MIISIIQKSIAVSVVVDSGLRKIYSPALPSTLLSYLFAKILALQTSIRQGTSSMYLTGHGPIASRKRNGVVKDICVRNGVPMVNLRQEKNLLSEQTICSLSDIVVDVVVAGKLYHGPHGMAFSFTIASHTAAT